MDFETFLNKIPKVELHCHLHGAVKVTTFIELAMKNGIDLPAYNDPVELYDFSNHVEFLKVYRKVCYSVQSREDFQRVTYETLEEASLAGVRYREMFWSPMEHLSVGVPFQTALDGIVDGVRDAEKDFAITCRIIAGMNREKTPEEGVEIVNLMLENPREELIGIGLGANEEGNPPEKFWKAYRLAAEAGLHRTAHAGEMGGHYRNIETSLDLLGCERIGHGYRILENEDLIKRCLDEGVVFEISPLGRRYALIDVRFPDEGSGFPVIAPDHEYGLIDSHRDVNWLRHPVKKMAERGLKIMINSDDPGIFMIDPAGAYVHAATNMDFSPTEIKSFVMNGIDGSWLDEAVKSKWRKEWGVEIDTLISQLDPCTDDD